MSSAEEDIQVSSTMRQALEGDLSHHLKTRAVVKVNGDLTQIAKIATGILPEVDGKAGFISLLTENGELDADAIAIAHDGGALLDVDLALKDRIVNRLNELQGEIEVDTSVSSNFRIFAETPSQKAADSSFEIVRFFDPRRRELGKRVIRDATEPEGLDWTHGRKWDVHALKLGILPDHTSLIGLGVTPNEAGYHKFSADNCDPSNENPSQTRRLLPSRVEPTHTSLPSMKGSQIVSGETVLGTMLDHEGLYGIAIVEIQKWRQALDTQSKITCEDEPVLITWPTWLSAESEGRYGPAGLLI